MYFSRIYFIHYACIFGSMSVLCIIWFYILHMALKGNQELKDIFWTKVGLRKIQIQKWSTVIVLLEQYCSSE